MQESSRYAVGIDVGTSKVRCVVGHVDPTSGALAIVGVGAADNSGMRKGTVVKLDGPAQAIDAALGEAERMSGYEINDATLSINGSHLVSTKADGMVAVGAADHQVEPDDLGRVQDVATMGKVPPNREIVEVVPYSYRLDGQDGIKDPVGMSGTRLELSANVVSALAPHVANLTKAAEMATVAANGTVPSAIAAARSTLTESQLESGVAIIDMGAATTGVAVFEEGDLQYLGVVPIGANNITNDLAIGLKVDPEIAEKVKLAHAVAVPRSDNEGVTLKHDSETLTFTSSDIDEIVDARLDEIFEEVQKHLKKAGRAGKLPSGVVLTGGGAQLKGIVEAARDKLGLSARLGKPTGCGGVNDAVDSPEFAVAVGLMFSDAEPGRNGGQSAGRGGRAADMAGGAARKAGGIVKNLFSKFKS